MDTEPLNAACFILIDGCGNVLYYQLELQQMVRNMQAPGIKELLRNPPEPFMIRVS